MNKAYQAGLILFFDAKIQKLLREHVENNHNTNTVPLILDDFVI